MASLASSLELVVPNPVEMVARGFLPENLPPSFNASMLAETFSRAGTAYCVDGKSVGSLAHYNASKRGDQRRLFGMPHPLFVWEQGLFFEQNWGLVKEALRPAAGSLSKPRFEDDGERAINITPHSLLAVSRLKALSRYKYCLVTDVARCYASIYSHSISWALHTREVAKKERNNPSLAANKLDFLVRQAQDGQTIGIPVGPDSSRIICEVVLSAVDQIFLESGKRPPVYLRHVDDYWVGGNSIEECEGNLSHLRTALRRFELDLNELKTKIVATNEVLSDSWPAEIEKEIVQGLSRAGRFTGGDPITTVSKILERASRDKDDGIIKLAIRKIDRRNLWGREWETLEHFLVYCAIQFPHSFDYVARVIAWRIRTLKSCDRALWAEIALRVASAGSSFGRDSEVLWALWLLKELGSKLPSKLAGSIALNSGPLVLAYLAHLHAKGLTSGKSLVRELQYRVEGDLWAGHYWPLSLELRHLDLWPSTWEKPQKDKPTCGLHEARVSLVNWAAVPRVFEDEDGRPPSYAIEDSSSYDELDDDNDDDEFPGASRDRDDDGF